jgi:hypothetical protein
VASRNYANHSQWQEKEKGQMMNATYGEKCLEQFKKLNPNTSLQKMSLVSRILTGAWFSSRCALTWKLKGTKFNRLLFQLQPKTLRTDEIGAGLLLKTPCSADAYTENLSKKEQKFGNSGTLAQEVQSGFIYQRGMLPTPQAQEGDKITGLENQDSMTKRVRQITGTTSQLNPRFVAEMMGFPVNWTELPFQNGEQNQSRVTETQFYHK